MKQKLALEVLSIYRQELAKAQFEVRHQQSELAAQQALLKTIDTADVNDVDLELLGAERSRLPDNCSSSWGGEKSIRFTRRGPSSPAQDRTTPTALNKT